MYVEKVYSNKRKSGFIVNGKWFLKVYHDFRSKRYVSAFRNLLYYSRPKREYVFSKFLREKGVPTVEIVKFKELKAFRVLPLNIGFSKAKFIKDLFPLPRLIREKGFRDLLYESIRISVKIHKLGLVHGDLSLSNFAVSEGNLLIIDLENMRRVGSEVLASREIIDYLHDIYKEAKKAGAEFDYFELFKFYVEEAGISGRRRKKLEKGFLSFFKERGINI